MDTLIWIILAVVVLAIIIWFAKGKGTPSEPKTPMQTPPPAEPPTTPPTEGGQGM